MLSILDSAEAVVFAESKISNQYQGIQQSVFVSVGGEHRVLIAVKPYQAEIHVAKGRHLIEAHCITNGGQDVIRTIEELISNGSFAP